MLNLAPSARFERARYGLEGRCSIQLSYEGFPESLRRMHWRSALATSVLVNREIGAADRVPRSRPSDASDHVAQEDGDERPSS